MVFNQLRLTFGKPVELFARTLMVLVALGLATSGGSAIAQGIIFGSGVEVLPEGETRVISGSGSGIWLLPPGGNLPNIGSGTDHGTSDWKWQDWGNPPPFLHDEEHVPIIIHDEYGGRFMLESEAGTVYYYLQPNYGTSYYQGSLQQGTTQWWEFSAGGAVIWFDYLPFRAGNQWKSYQLEEGESYVFRRSLDGRKLELYRRS